MAKSLEQIQAEAESAYQNAVVIPRWLPPDGTGYRAQLTDVLDWVGANQDGQEEQHVALIGEIEGGDYAGRRICLGRFNPRNMGMFKEIAELILGNSTGFADDLAALRQRVGTLLQFDVRTRTSRQGREFTGCTITDVLDAVTAEQEPAAE